MAPGTVVGLLGTTHLVELEVSTACSKESNSLTRLDVAWLPDTRKAADLYHWWWRVGRPPVHQTAQVSKKKRALPWSCLLQLQSRCSGYEEDMTDGGVYNSGDVPQQVAEISERTKLIRKSTSFPLSHLC